MAEFNFHEQLETLAKKLHLIAAKYSVQIEMYQHRLKAADELLTTYGWVQFGTHANDPCKLEFSTVFDIDGLPLYERVI